MSERETPEIINEFYEQLTNNGISSEFSQSSVSLLNEFAALTEAASSVSMYNNASSFHNGNPQNTTENSTNTLSNFQSNSGLNSYRLLSPLPSPSSSSSQPQLHHQPLQKLPRQTPPQTLPTVSQQSPNKRVVNPPYLERIYKSSKTENGNGNFMESNQIFLEIRNLKQRVEILESAINTLLSDRSHGYSLNCLKTNIPSLDSKVSSVVGKTSDISRVHLDRFCLSILRHNIEPDSSSLAAISIQLEPLYLHFDRKTCIAHIRKWFRKRREEMGMRIISCFRKGYSRILENDEDRRSLQKALKNDTYHQILDIKQIIKLSDLEVVNVDVATQFSLQKISSFLDRYEQQGASAR